MLGWAPPWVYFSDAILRAPTLGCILMCLSASLIGVFTFLKKQSLVGETLSHATFPGVMIGILVTGWLTQEDSPFWTSIWTLSGAFIAALIGLLFVHLLETRIRVRTDSALTFVLSLFFGFGVTLASRIQFSHTTLYQQSLSYLYGQAATMTDEHVLIYGVLCFISIFTIILFYKEFQAVLFDPQYAKSLGIPAPFIQGMVLFLSTLAIVIGIRSVGVVLISAMLIAPAVCARQLTHKLHLMLIFAGIVGLVSGFLGVYLSMEISQRLTEQDPSSRISLPTGPMIVMVATFFSLAALLCAPERGLIPRFIRKMRFQRRCLIENLLKDLWRIRNPCTIQELAILQHIRPRQLFLLLRRLSRHGWIKKTPSGAYALTEDGTLRAEGVVRKHRLWELYLTRYLGMGADKVHRSAEEMEHILTPELERELDRLLDRPTTDPHHQPIPRTHARPIYGNKAENSFE